MPTSLIPSGKEGDGSPTYAALSCSGYSETAYVCQYGYTNGQVISATITY